MKSSHNSFAVNFMVSLKKSALLAGVAVFLSGCAVYEPYPSYADYPGGPYYSSPYYYQPAPPVVVSPPPVGFFFGDFRRGHGGGGHHSRGHFRHH